MPEAAFNAACYHTGLGDYQNALEELGRAETLCRQTYDDQEDELSSELAQVRLQDSTSRKLLVFAGGVNSWNNAEYNFKEQDLTSYSGLLILTTAGLASFEQFL